MPWFRKKSHPDYWQAYATTFKQAAPQQLEEVVFVVLDTETTGLQPAKDRMLSIGAVKLVGREIALKDVFEVYLEQTAFSAETVAVHGIRKGQDRELVTEEKALQRFLAYIGNAVLLAHHANFDIAMINQALKRQGLPRLKNRVADTADVYRRYISAQKSVSLDSLCEAYGLVMHDRHTATGDAYLTALVFLKMLKEIRKNRSIRLTDLYLERDLSRGLL